MLFWKPELSVASTRGSQPGFREATVFAEHLVLVEKGYTLTIAEFGFFLFITERKFLFQPSKTKVKLCYIVIQFVPHAEHTCLQAINYM